MPFQTEKRAAQSFATAPHISIKAKIRQKLPIPVGFTICGIYTPAVSAGTFEVLCTYCYPAETFTEPQLESTDSALFSAQ